MEVLTLAIACPGGRPPAKNTFLHDGCFPQSVPARSPCPGAGPAEEAGRQHALAGLLAIAIGRRDQSADEYGGCGG
jgi:hypothetical protein